MGMAMGIVWPAVICCLLLLSHGHARELLKIDSTFDSGVASGEELTVLADKAYRRGGEKVIKLIGNVMITRGEDVLYGEAGQVDLAKKRIDVEGKVRFTNPNLSMYGSKLIYSMANESLQIFDARAIAKAFSLHGKRIERKSKDVIIGENAEYSACQDCPNSWSVYGGQVKITLREYITIKDAVVKVRGMPMAYLPYFIFPIKGDRSSGLLFPKIDRSSTTDGVIIKQPIFWAISPSQDMTLVPTVFGERGIGGEFEHRSVFGHDRWLSINGLDIFDGQYNPVPTQKTEKKADYNRYFVHYEHNFRWGHQGNHHLTVNNARERDIVRDFDREVKGFYYGNELGVEGFLEWRNSIGQVSLSSYFVDDLMVDDSREFAHHTVQVLPRVTMASTPFRLAQTDLPLFSSVTSGIHSEVTNFKQNHSTDKESGPIRNAVRYDIGPYLDIMVANWGPVQLSTRLNWDYQLYQLPQVATTDSMANSSSKFEKWAVLAQSELSFELGKTYGLAYQVNIPTSEVRGDFSQWERKKTKGENDSAIIGSLPPFDGALVEDWVTVKKNSHRHTQEWKLIHYQIIDSNHSGNSVFAKQLQSDKGLFDIVDAFRGREVEVAAAQGFGKLPKQNVIELQWNNSVIQKTPKDPSTFSDGFYQRDHFNYRNVFYFNISQGFNMDGRDYGSRSERSLRNQLTRLAVETGLTFDKFTLASKELYFYDGRHIYELSLNTLGRYVDSSLGFLFNSVDEDVASDSIRIGLTLRPTSTMVFKGTYDLDISSQEENNRQNYEVTYIPDNNCWRLRLELSDDAIETRIGLDFQVQWNNDFKGLL